MTAAALLAELHDAGIRLSVNGDRLHVEAKPGTVTPALRERLVANKPGLLALLESPDTIRTHLMNLAALHGIPLALVEHLLDADLAACVGLGDDVLTAYVRALDRATVMDRGVAPPAYAQPAHCDGCGSVLLWQGAPARVIACPWCFRRKAGKPIPRPP